MKKIYVGNLDFSEDEGSLRALFENYGRVESVHIVTDRDTGRSRGFAFLEMAEDGAADRAITELNGTTLGSRVLNVNVARPKTQRSDGGLRGGRSGTRRW